MFRSQKIIQDMKVTTNRIFASLVLDIELNERYIISDVFDKRCAKVFSEKVIRINFLYSLEQIKGGSKSIIKNILTYIISFLFSLLNY